MLTKEREKELRKLAVDIRGQIARCIAHTEAHSGHVGGSFSLAELMAVLYGEVMRVDPQNPKWKDRDYFVLSKGHCGPALYATLALRGFFPMELLDTMNRGGTDLPSHSDRLHTPGVDMSTGSLGQGASTAVGLAYADKLDGRGDRYTYLVLGDGEITEGQVWEAANFAAAHGLGTLIAFVDKNGKMDPFSPYTADPENISQRFAAFGWDAQDCDGHNVRAVYDCIQRAKGAPGPSVIVLHTHKGKSIPEIEEMETNHSIPVGDELLEKLTQAFERQKEEIDREGGM